jgi:hypothetical protein
MTQEHRIAPLPSSRLMQQWIDDYFNGCPIRGSIAGLEAYMAARGAEWGADEANRNIERERQEAADEELEACCEWIHSETSDECFVANLRDARRPKPKSEKQQALEAFDRIEYAPSEAEDFAIILRVLKSIPDEQ